MADDKRNRPDPQPSGTEADRQRNRDRKPGGNIESPDRSSEPRQDQEEPQE
jgi:hypothetical protein